MICPICTKERSKKLFEIQRPDIGRNIVYVIWKCESCTFIYAKGPLNEAILSRIYSTDFHATSQQYAPINEDGKFTSESLKCAVVKNAIDRVRLLLQLEAHGDLLDIGAARGYFVKAASEVFNAEGIELNPEAANFGVLMGVKIASGNFLTHDFGDRKFDVITLWDVLASLPQPNITMKKISALIKPGGMLVMTVPDGNSLISRLFGRYWPLMIPPVNMAFYTRTSIKEFLINHGFELRHLRYDSKHVSVDFLLHKILKAIGLYGIANIKLPVRSSLCIPLNLWDIITVVAVKAAQ